MVRRYDRRDFMGVSGAGVAGLLASPWAVSRALAAVDHDPDLVVTNAKVYTVDPAAPYAEAFAVKAGRFVAVGTTDEVKALAGKRTRTFDAKQMTVVPGFIDAHNHAPGTILRYEVLVGNPYEVEFVTIDSIVEKLRARARETPPGFWVEGFFFDDTKVKDKRALDVHDLDRVSTEHPVSVRHRGGHTSYYNSKAFALAGITKSTPNSAAGTFDRDAKGELNGRVTDRARLVFAKVGMRPAYSADETRRRNRDGSPSSPRSSCAMA
jgi:predicted amidohydrolase YtcJ